MLRILNNGNGMRAFRCRAVYDTRVFPRARESRVGDRGKATSAARRRPNLGVARTHFGPGAMRIDRSYTCRDVVRHV